MSENSEYISYIEIVEEDEEREVNFILYKN